MNSPLKTLIASLCAKGFFYSVCPAHDGVPVVTVTEQFRTLSNAEQAEYLRVVEEYFRRVPVVI